MHSSCDAPDILPYRRKSRGARGTRSGERDRRRVVTDSGTVPGSAYVTLPWQCLYFLPEPQGQGVLRAMRSLPAGLLESVMPEVWGLRSVADGRSILAGMVSAN